LKEGFEEMTDDSRLKRRIHDLLMSRGSVEEKRIVGGGQGFMSNGHLCCGLSKRGLTVRVGPEGKAAAIAQPGVRPLKVGSRETAAFVLVSLKSLEDDGALEAWVERCVEFVRTL